MRSFVFLPDIKKSHIKNELLLRKVLILAIKKFTIFHLTAGFLLFL